MSKGFAPILLLLVIPLIIGLLFFISTKFSFSPLNQTSLLKTFDKAKEDVSKLNSNVSWEFGYETKTWTARGIPPACPDPLIFPSPVDLNKASGILYPGQIRGGDYKPHGGIRFDNRDTNDIEVRAIMDGYILRASRYEDIGDDVQYFLFYVNNCGIMVMHDHLLTLSPKLHEVFDKIPLNKNGDSRTTEIHPRVEIKKGEVLATEIGYEYFPGGYKDKNVFVDFGLYDLRKTNGIDYDPAYRAKHPNIVEHGTHALCWFDYLSSTDEETVRNLPASGNEGKVSDYCK